MTDAAITAHAPAQHNVVTDRARRQVYCCSDKSTRSPSPRHTAGERVTKGATNCPSVATGNKAAACSNDVRKHAAADADLQHAAVVIIWGASF